MATYKAINLSRHLADDLKKRFDSMDVSETFDGSDPVITISDGTPAAGEKVIVIRTASAPNPEAKDILGNSANHYTPHKFQIVTEANNEAGAGDDILAAQDLLNVLGDVAKRSAMVEWYQTANGTVPAVSEITTANLVATWSELYWGIQKSS